MLNYRICFAPLRFGAGLKGKIVDSWWHGLPVSTTPVGCEGMTLSNFPNQLPSWGSATTESEIVDQTVGMYEDEAAWKKCQAEGFLLLNALYDKERNLASIQVRYHVLKYSIRIAEKESYAYPLLQNSITTTMKTLQELRDADYTGSILWSQQMRSTEFFSRWIELKETS